MPPLAHWQRGRARERERERERERKTGKAAAAAEAGRWLAGWWSPLLLLLLLLPSMSTPYILPRLPCSLLVVTMATAVVCNDYLSLLCLAGQEKCSRQFFLCCCCCCWRCLRGYAISTSRGWGCCCCWLVWWYKSRAPHTQSGHSIGSEIMNSIVPLVCLTWWT